MRRMQIMLAVIAVLAIVSLAFDAAILLRLGDGSVGPSPSQVQIEQPADSLGGKVGEKEKRELDEEQQRQKSPRRSRGR